MLSRRPCVYFSRSSRGELSSPSRIWFGLIPRATQMEHSGSTLVSFDFLTLFELGSPQTIGMYSMTSSRSSRAIYPCLVRMESGLRSVNAKKTWISSAGSPTQLLPSHPQITQPPSRTSPVHTLPLKPRHLSIPHLRCPRSLRAPSTSTCPYTAMSSDDSPSGPT